MASSYSGDPWNFWQPNNPFLEMMAAIDGPGDDVQQQQQQANTERRSGNIKLPDFWPAAPAIWFARAELRFEVAGILSEREKFAHAVNALPQDATRLVTDLIIAPPADRPYKALKERLLLSHQLSPVQKAAKVLGMPAIGDRRPSQLLADLLEYCPAGEENSAFFRAVFVQRLPSDMQALLDGLEDGDLKELAQKADKLWAIRRPADMAVAAVTDSDSHQLEDPDCVVALKPHFKRKEVEKKSGGNNSGGGNNYSASHGGGGGGKRPPKMFSVCYRHMKFGSAAFKCDDPSACGWKGN